MPMEKVAASWYWQEQPDWQCSIPRPWALIRTSTTSPGRSIVTLPSPNIDSSTVNNHVTITAIMMTGIWPRWGTGTTGTASSYRASAWATYSITRPLRRQRWRDRRCGIRSKVYSPPPHMKPGCKLETCTDGISCRPFSISPPDLTVSVLYNIIVKFQFLKQQLQTFKLFWEKPN